MEHKSVYNSSTDSFYNSGIFEWATSSPEDLKKSRESDARDLQKELELRDRLFEYVEDIVENRQRTMLIILPSSYVGIRVVDLGYLKNRNSNEYKSYYDELILPAEMKYIYRLGTDSTGEKIEAGETEKDNLNFISIMPEIPTYFGYEGAQDYAVDADLSQSIRKGLPPAQLVGSDGLFSLLSELENACRKAIHKEENIDTPVDIKNPIFEHFEAIKGLAKSLNAAA